MTWEEFTDEYFDIGWFDQSDRPKTELALQQIYERVPHEILEELSVLIFAPGSHLYGQLYPNLPRDKALIYLAPHLEKESQSDVDFTVAHEFAHAHLGHSQSVLNSDLIEDEADQLTVNWGFVLPERRRNTKINMKVLKAFRADWMTLMELVQVLPELSKTDVKKSLTRLRNLDEIEMSMRDNRGRHGYTKQYRRTCSGRQG
jgi:hypothetical protein